MAVVDEDGEGSTASGVVVSEPVTVGEAEHPTKHDDVTDGGGEAVAVTEPDDAADTPKEPVDVAVNVCDAVLSGVLAADGEMDVDSVPVTEALLDREGVTADVPVSVGVIELDQLVETVAAAVPDADAPALTVLVAVAVPVLVNEGVGGSDADADVLAETLAERDVVGETEGDADGGRQAVRMTEPLPPAVPAAPPPV